MTCGTPEDLTGVYAEDRGDTCLVDRCAGDKPWCYQVVCTSGAHFATGPEEIRQRITLGCYTLLRALAPKPKIDETFRAKHV